MATTYQGVGGGQNVFVPGTGWNNAQAGALLQVEYSRNPRSFPINKYAQIVPVNASSGWFYRINPVDAMRINGANNFVWPEGSDAPVGKDQNVAPIQYTTTRYSYPFQFSSKTAQQAAWDIVASHARSKMQLAMTDRTRAMLVQLTTEANWDGNYSATTGFGSWTSSNATTEQYIKKTIMSKCQAINIATGGTVGPKDINLIVNPIQWAGMLATAEIQAYLVNNVNARSALEQNEQWDLWGAPSRLYGVNLVIEDTVSNTVLQGAATQTQGYVLGNAVAIFCGRPGGLVANNDAPSFNCAQINTYEDFTVEQQDDTWNRVTKGRVTQDIAPIVAAPLSGYLIASTAS